MGKIGTSNKIIIYTRSIEGVISVQIFDIYFDFAKIGSDTLSLSFNFKTTRELDEYVEYINSNIDAYDEITVWMNNKTFPIFLRKK